MYPQFEVAPLTPCVYHESGNWKTCSAFCLFYPSIFYGVMGCPGEDDRPVFRLPRFWNALWAFLLHTKDKEKRKQHYYFMPFWLMKLFLRDLANVLFWRLMLLYRKKIILVPPIAGKMKWIFGIKCFYSWVYLANCYCCHS